MSVVDVVNNPLVVGLAVATLSPLGWLVYRRSVKLDKAAAAATVVATQSNAIKQVIDGLNKIINNLQEDNQVLRKNLKELATLLEESLKENQRLKRLAASLNRKYNGK